MIIDGIKVLTSGNTSASLTDASGKVTQAQLPAVAITNTNVVASQAAMLALTAQEGDVAIRTDVSKSYILIGSDPTQLSNWQEMLATGNQVNADWNAASGVSQILNKPTIPYDIAGSMSGKPANGATIARLVAVRAFTIPAGATSSLAKSSVAATASTTYTMKKNGTAFGTFAFAASGTTGTFTVASQTSFAAGDVLTVDAPGTADATHADMEFTLVATLA